MKKSYVKYVSTVLVLALALVLITAAVPDAAFAGASYRGDVNPGLMGKLTAPKVTAKTAGRTSIQLKWKAVKGAKGYVVYRSEGQFGKNFKKVKTIKTARHPAIRIRSANAIRSMNTKSSRISIRTVSVYTARLDGLRPTPAQ